MNRKFECKLTGQLKEKIRYLYLKKKYTQEKISNIIGIDRTAVSYWTRKWNISRNLSESHKGQHCSLATEFKKGDIRITGKNNPRWRGGVNYVNRQTRESDEYKTWRRDVFVRDSFTCQKCGHKYIRIIAHHIKSFADYPKLRFIINNGKTYCRKCHCKLHNPALKEQI